MSEPRPVVGLACDVKQVGIHPFHAVGEKYINAVANGSGCLPVLLPALGGGTDLEALDDKIDFNRLVNRFDGLFLPGSASNVNPAIYGSDLEFEAGDLDNQRDATTLRLIQAALAEGVPLLVVCRGFQELNVALGGSLHQHVQDVPGLDDHREDKSLPREGQYAPAHEVTLAEGGLLRHLAGKASVHVNSIHGQGIDRLADGLTVEATAPDGLVEAVRVQDAAAFAVGIQWHAEWRYHEDPLATALFAAFGEAARERARGRQND